MWSEVWSSTGVHIRRRLPWLDYSKRITRGRVMWQAEENSDLQLSACVQCLQASELPERKRRDITRKEKTCNVSADFIPLLCSVRFCFVLGADLMNKDETQLRFHINLQNVSHYCNAAWQLTDKSAGKSVLERTTSEVVPGTIWHFPYVSFSLLLFVHPCVTNVTKSKCWVKDWPYSSGFGAECTVCHLNIS